jgi:hypothetical protein
MSTALRLAFQQPVLIPVRVTRLGFLVPSAINGIDSLEGRVTKMTSLRTRFDRGKIVCSSPDGTRRSDGYLCVECLHPKCRLQLRIHLREGMALYVIHLNVPSANNLLDLESDARHEGDELHRWRLQLTILDHGTWPEVRFRRLS